MLGGDGLKEVESQCQVGSKVCRVYPCALPANASRRGANRFPYQVADTPTKYILPFYYHVMIFINGFYRSTAELIAVAACAKHVDVAGRTASYHASLHAGIALVVRETGTHVFY